MTSRSARVLPVALLAFPGIAHAQACGAALGPNVERAESSRYVVAWRADPAPIVVSRHFALDVVVCGKAGAPPARTLRVDATMPAHRHGMNYRPTVAPAGAGRFRVEGLMFHMPGAWEFAFDVANDEGSERLRAPFELR
jgi:hypothetical protein